MTYPSIALKHVDFEINRIDRIVKTTFRDSSLYVCGTREVNQQNINEALAQGYLGDDPSIVWKSLVHHEFLHSLIAEVLFDSISPVLAHEAGIEQYPSWDRYYEEAIVLAIQYWTNSGMNAFCLQDRRIARKLGIFDERWAEHSKAIEGHL